MKLHCEALYDSLTQSNDTLLGNDAFCTRTQKRHIVVVTDSTQGSAALLSAKICHLLSLRASSLSAWEGLVIQLMNWGAEWKHLIALVVYDDETQLSMFAQFHRTCICLHREFKFIPLSNKEIQHKETTIYLSVMEMVANDFISIFRNPHLWEEIGHHLTLGWQRDFGVNSTMMLKERQPCTRLFLNDIMLRINRIIRRVEDSFTCVVQLRTPKEAVLMLGPPSDPAMDEVAVRRLVQSDASVKIVCGGTTSEIVARCLNRRLIIIPTSCTDIPPISWIDGIDLVSEGVLTLQKTIELLELLHAMPSLVLTFHDLYQYDGAFHLTRILCSQCTNIHFMLGLAKNEDHEYLEDICFQTKLNLGQKLMSLLIQMGKYVTVEYF